MDKDNVLNEIWEEIMTDIKEEDELYDSTKIFYEDIMWQWYIMKYCKTDYKMNLKNPNDKDFKRIEGSRAIYKDLAFYTEFEKAHGMEIATSIEKKWGLYRKNKKHNFSIGLDWVYKCESVVSSENSGEQKVINMPNEKFFALHIMLLQNQEFINLFCDKAMNKRYDCAINVVKYARKLEENSKKRNKLIKNKDKNDNTNYDLMVDMTTEYGYIYEKLTGVNLALLFMNYYCGFKQIIKGCEREEELMKEIKEELETIAKTVVKSPFIYTRIVKTDEKLKDIYERIQWTIRDNKCKEMVSFNWRPINIGEELKKELKKRIEQEEFVYPLENDKELKQYCEVCEKKKINPKELCKQIERHYNETLKTIRNGLKVKEKNTHTHYQIKEDMYQEIYDKVYDEFYGEEDIKYPDFGTEDGSIIFIKEGIKKKTKDNSWEWEGIWKEASVFLIVILDEIRKIHK